MEQTYDALIMGGGPAGSLLAALLRRRTGRSVLVVESEQMPREHIGESLVHACMPVIEEAGALRALLASDCWVQKFGGIFWWEKDRPSVTFFDHPDFLHDGVHRWALHVDRAQFDKILLDNARDQGAEVIEGVSVKSWTPDADGGVAELSDGRRVRARLFADASGRNSRVAARRKPSFLSSYKNMAIWNHYTGCIPAQRAQGDWNVFREGDLSPIACVAFPDGWVWFIPVPKVIDGQRVMTHSIGIVTDPRLVQDPDKDYTRPDLFLKTIQALPLLGGLTLEAQAVRPEMQVIANYSMIQERFCDLDERWLLTGDAAYFVDPLFSSGVTFASGMASAAALLIDKTLSGDRAAAADLWRDYDEDWHGIAHSFALAIDQWYHAIAADHPGSIYWKTRLGKVQDLGIRRESFQSLVDAAITPDLLQVMTSGSFDQRDLNSEGPFVRLLASLDAAEPADTARLTLAPGVTCRPAGTVAVGFPASIMPPDVPQELRQLAAEYWRRLQHDPIPFPSLHDDLMPCARFEDGQHSVRQPFDVDGAMALHAMLSGEGQTYGALKARLSPPQGLLLRKLVVAGLVRVDAGVAGKAAREPVGDVLMA